MTDITKWLEDFEQRLELNTLRLRNTKSMLVELAVQMHDPLSDRADILRRMESWIGLVEKFSSERNDLISELEEKRRDVCAAVVRASAALLNDSGQPYA